jgi:hypothetical protein
MGIRYSDPKAAETKIERGSVVFLPFSPSGNLNLCASVPMYFALCNIFRHRICLCSGRDELQQTKSRHILDFGGTINVNRYVLCFQFLPDTIAK